MSLIRRVREKGQVSSVLPKAPEDWRSPKAGVRSNRPEIREAFWTAPVLALTENHETLVPLAGDVRAPFAMRLRRDGAWRETQFPLETKVH
jgi:hypothetical protein